jgi:DNA-binding NtrC family response regulator
MEPRILVVDGNRDDLECVRGHLAACGYAAVDVLPDPQKAAGLFESGAAYDVALLAVESMEDAHLLRALRQNNPGTECILLAACNGVPPVVQWLRQGAFGCLVKPFAMEDLLSSVEKALERKRLLDLIQAGRSQPAPAGADSAAFAEIVTCSRPLLRVLKQAELLAASAVPVLITGESGTGRELLARAVHAASPRAGRPFVRIALQSMSPESIEAELFGSAQAAAAGTSPQAGTPLLASCHRGSLFLKGIETLAARLQGSLVQVLRGEAVGTQLEAAGVRLLAASHEGLPGLLNTRRLRSELVYWMRAGWLHLPPLRERPEDIPLLIDYFMKKNTRRGTVWRVEEGAFRTLQSYRFPGNVAELQAILGEAVGRARDHVITQACLPESLQGRPGSPQRASALALSAIEEQHILRVYHQMGRNKVRTARALGVGLNTLRRKLKTYDVK